MPTTTLVEESRAHRGFSVPQFEIRIDGAGLPNDVLRDVSQLTYRDTLKDIDGFELLVNNWDAAKGACKYVGNESSGDLKGSGASAERARMFDPDRSIEIRAGYAGDLRTLLKGTFTTLEPSFPSGAVPTITVRGVNALHRLRRKQYSTTWTQKRDSEIAKDIGQMSDSTLGSDQKRFPMPIVVSDDAQAREAAIPYLAQLNQYDIDFLLCRAKRLGYVVSLREGDAKATDPDLKKTHLYFGPSDGRQPGLRESLYKLRWGTTLLAFRPTLTIANQVQSVTVKGWDRTKKKEILVTVSLGDRELAVNTDLHDMLTKGSPRSEVVVEKPFHTKEEAKQVAIGILNDRQKQLVTASADCVGLPALRAGCKVDIDGIGARFSGTYFVVGTTHSWSDLGYMTHFEARREVTR